MNCPQLSIVLELRTDFACWRFKLLPFNRRGCILVWFAVDGYIFKRDIFHSDDMIYLRRCYAIECAVLYFDITSLHFIFKAFKIQYILALFAGDIFKMYIMEVRRIRPLIHITNTVAQIRELTAGILRPLYYARIYFVLRLRVWHWI